MKPFPHSAGFPPTCPPIVVATPDGEELSFLRRQLLAAGITHPLVTFEEAESLLDYLGAVCIAASAEPRLKPCLLFLDDRLVRAGNGDVIEWVRRQPALQDLRVVVLSDREPARTDRTAAAVQFVARFPAAATLAWMVASACGGNMA